MGYSGLVAREHSSGNRIQRGGITKTGNGHLRRVLVEAAWAYQHRPSVIGFLLHRQKSLGISDEDIAWKAQQRLHKRYKDMAARGQNKNQIVTAIGREMLDFIWPLRSKRKSSTSSQKPPERSLFDQLDGSADDSARDHERRTLLTFCAERFPNPTRVLSPRQLPTDHDHAVPTRE